MTTDITTAMVLAAGLGKRMQPLTDTMPKPLVPLNGRALLDHVLDRIADAGLKRAVINVHYLADQLEKHVSHRALPAISISDERDEILETGGGVVRALPLLGSQPFVIHNSDSVWIEPRASNIARLIKAWDGTVMDSLMLLAPRVTSLGYDGHGDFGLSADGRLKRRAPGGEAPYVFAGVSIAHPRMFDGAKEERFSLNVLWDKAIERGRLFGLLLDGTWMHVGTVDALRDAERLIQSAALEPNHAGHTHRGDA
jgi:N-acetyl-alpha-D-muramate 1-phosphate uridylyltransferase